jgi:transposase
MNRYVGVDLGIRTNHRAAVLDGPVPRGKPFSVTATREGFEELLRRATEGAEGPVKFVLEPTGLAWVPLAAYMSAAGHEVYLAKPKKASDLRKFLHQHVKSDSADAEANGLLPQVDPRGVHRLSLPTAEQMTLRRLVKRRERLVQQAADGKRRIHALMVMANPPLMAALGESAFGDAAMAFYRSYADPQQVVNLGLPRLRKFWHRASRGKADPQLSERVFKACQTTVALYSEQRRTGQLPFDYVAVGEELQAELDWIDRYEQEVVQLDDRITEIYHCIDPDRILETIPGIAKVIAPALEALVGDVERFLNSRCFVSYCGLCPRKKQSGLSDQPMPITKAGQRLLKKYFYLAAETARQWDPEFAAYYARRYARGDTHNRIMIALAHKMAMRVYAVLKRRSQARQSTAEDPTPPYELRNPEGRRPIDKREARQLILEKYTRASADPQRHRRDRARRGKNEGAAPAKVEWPSKDATSSSTAPSPQIPRSGNEHNRIRTEHSAGPVSVGDVLAQMFKGTPVEIPLKTCESHSVRISSKKRKSS